VRGKEQDLVESSYCQTATKLKKIKTGSLSFHSNSFSILIDPTQEESHAVNISVLFPLKFFHLRKLGEQTFYS